MDFTHASGPNDAAGSFAQYTGDNAKTNAALLTPVHAISAARGATLAQVALAWLHQQSDVHGLPVVPIPGTRKRTRLIENLGATQLTLTDAELAALEPIAAQVVGDRYPDMTQLM